MGTGHGRRRRPGKSRHWRAKALGWTVVDEGAEVVEIRPAPDRTPGILFLLSNDVKKAKNRLHLDFRPNNQTAEVDRLLGLGASRIDIDQGSVSSVVLADLEGNEFCVLRESSD
ncbi:MAG: VOC family protein [Acidimicrobiales bacterium]|nr:VOC family protein [Acidimicrobiales bacterium]